MLSGLFQLAIPSGGQGGRQSTRVQGRGMTSVVLSPRIKCFPFQVL